MSPHVLLIILYSSSAFSVNTLKQNSYALSSSNARRADAKLALSPSGINKALLVVPYQTD
jgi:hypothetical protein